MAHFNKVGLLILNEARTQFLTCEKNHFTSDYLMPGGKYEPGEDDAQCLTRELREELGVELNVASLQFIGEYTDVAAGDTTKDVCVRLYTGVVVGDPRPCGEIVLLHWIGAADRDNPRVSPLIRNKVLPDLIAREILFFSSEALLRSSE